MLVGHTVDCWVNIACRHGWVKIVLLGGMGMEWELTGVKWGRLADRDRDRRLADIDVYIHILYSIQDTRSDFGAK